MAYASVPLWIKEIPERVKTQEMCIEEVHIEPYTLDYALDCLKAEEMCK